jgi:hypothetical protein
MATKLFLKDAVADTHLGTDNLNLLSAAVGWTSKALSTTQGSSVVASDNVATVAGATAGIAITKTSPVEWISPPVSADVTISGTITGNVWASETNMSANVSICMVVEVIRANATATRNSNTIVEIGRRAPGTEIAVTTRAVNNFTITPTSTVVNRGDRLRVRLFGDDVTGGVNMASTYTFNASWDGGAAADGDTHITFTENFSFESAPAGSQLFLTNEQSGLSAAPALISDFTGADENPLSEGGNWANLNSSGSPLQRISNAVAGSAAADCHSYWTPANFGPDLEAYATLPNVVGNVGIVARVQGEGGAGTWDGYRVRAVGGSNTAQSSVVTNATVTVLISVAQTWSANDKIGMRVEGSTIQMWRQAAGSGDWNLMATAVDTTYSSAGKIGLNCGSTTVRIDDFYAATDSNLFTQKAWTSRGAGVVSYLSDTDTGWTAPLYTHDWYTPELEAFTLTGMAQANIRALESSASANASLRCELARVDSDGTNPTVWASWCCAPTGTDNGELTTSEVARTINVSGDDLAFTDGQRLRIRLYNEDISSAAMGNAFNVQRFFNGTSGGASGDSYITLPQSVSEYVTATAGSALQTMRPRRAQRFLTSR